MNPADEIVTLAIGVPEGTREERTRHFLGIFERLGYRATEVTPDDFVRQGAHVLQVRASQAASEKQTNDQKEKTA